MTRTDCIVSEIDGVFRVLGFGRLEKWDQRREEKAERRRVCFCVLTRWFNRHPGPQGTNMDEIVPVETFHWSVVSMCLGHEEKTRLRRWWNDSFGRLGNIHLSYSHSLGLLLHKCLKQCPRVRGSFRGNFDRSRTQKWCSVAWFFFPGPGSIQPGSLERSTSERSPFLFRKQAMRDTTVLSMHIMHVVAAVKQFTASVLLKMGWP